MGSVGSFDDEPSLRHMTLQKGVTQRLSMVYDPMGVGSFRAVGLDMNTNRHSRLLSTAGKKWRTTLERTLFVSQIERILLSAVVRIPFGP